MSSIAALPPSLRQKILFLARRIRLLRALHGSSLLLVMLLITGSAAVFMDYWLGLPAAVRWVLLIAWACVGTSVAVRAICLPLCRKLTRMALAALVEEKHPDQRPRSRQSHPSSGRRARWHHH